MEIGVDSVIEEDEVEGEDEEHPEVVERLEVDVVVGRREAQRQS